MCEGQGKQLKTETKCEWSGAAYCHDFGIIHTVQYHLLTQSRFLTGPLMADLLPQRLSPTASFFAASYSESPDLQE